MVVLLTLTACIVLGLILDGDLDDLAAGRIVPPSVAEARYDKTKLLSAEQGALAFAVGSWGSLSTDTLQVSAVPWVLVSAVLALMEAEGNIEDVSHEGLQRPVHRRGYKGTNDWINSRF
ncbi:MAG: hypothetical protein AAF788_03740 [Pseudomonadota bacterium]